MIRNILQIGEDTLARKAISHYHALAKQRGWQWSGSEALGVGTKTEWECNAGHTVLMDYEHVKRGHGCQTCNNRLPKTDADYRDLAEQCQLIWIGPSVDRRNAKTGWKCAENHAWESSYNDILASSECSVCVTELESNAHYLQELAQAANLSWDGLTSDSLIPKSKWRCDRGHSWIASGHSIKRGRRCKTCTKETADAKIRFGPDDYDKLAAQLGVFWLRGDIGNSQTKTTWSCSVGHFWDSTYANLRQSGACPHCRKATRLRQRKSLGAECESVAHQRNFRWLGPDIQTKRERTRWRCESDHEWESVFGEIVRGSGCPTCARLERAQAARLKSADYEALARQKGITWIGPLVSATNIKTEWVCSQRHHWLAQYNNILHDMGCPKCASHRKSEKRRLKAADYHNLAQEKGLAWLGPEVRLTKDKTWWQCSELHKWEATYQRARVTGCVLCNKSEKTSTSDRRNKNKLSQQRKEIPSSSHSKKVPILSHSRVEQIADFALKNPQKSKRTTENYHELAKRRGMLWIGPEVKTTHTKTTWQCTAGHQWQAIFTKILQGRGCPTCAHANQSERQRKKPDDYKAMGLSRGFQWIGPTVDNNNKKTGWKCQKGHEWQAPLHSLTSGQGCPTCGKQSAAIKLSHSSDDYLEAASQRGFKWLGPPVPNALTRTGWECHLGHQWQAQFSNIKNGSRCPECSRQMRGDATRNDVMDYQGIAKKFNILWLGPVVANVNEKTGWRCQDNHDWQMSHSGIRRGYGCPVCNRQRNTINARLKVQDYVDVATAVGLRWLGPEVERSNDKTGWECSKGHKWKADYNHIKSGRNCPTCGRSTAGDATRHSEKEYEALAASKKFVWLGPTARNILADTEWECPKGHRWIASYRSVKKLVGCPGCSNAVDGTKVSTQQMKLAKMVGGIVNFKFGGYKVDAALVDDKIAVEYDSWFWHGKKQAYDMERNKYFLSLGWKMLRVKSNHLLPSQSQIETALDELKSHTDYVEICLEDWGIGRVWNED